MIPVFLGFGFPKGGTLFIPRLLLGPSGGYDVTLVGLLLEEVKVALIGFGVCGLDFRVSPTLWHVPPYTNSPYL